MTKQKHETKKQGKQPMNTILFELGTEELPPKSLKTLQININKFVNRIFLRYFYLTQWGFV